MVITSHEELRALYGPASARSVAKELTYIDTHTRDFIAASPFILLSTASTTGQDVSPKGDHPGFVHVEDDTHLLIPDRPGNNRLDGLLNLIENPAIGIIFLIPTVGETLRINGTGTIHDDPDLCALFEVNKKCPKTVLRVHVKEVFLHCAKSLMRSHLWQPDQWPQERPVPPLNVMIREQTAALARQESEEDFQARMRATLY